MGLDIYFIEDIRNAILAADEASSSTARICAVVTEDPLTLRAYLEGFRAALCTVALSFGVSPASIRPVSLGAHKEQEEEATTDQGE